MEPAARRHRVSYFDQYGHRHRALGQVPKTETIPVVFLEKYLAFLVVVFQVAWLLLRPISLDERPTASHLIQVTNVLNENLNAMDYRQSEAAQIELNPLQNR